MQNVAILAARRTPLGGFQGTLSSMTAPELAAITMRAVANDAGLIGEKIDEALIGEEDALSIAIERP